MKWFNFRDDRGFSLTELLMVSGLLSVVLAAGFTGLLAVQRAQKVSQGQADMAAGFGDPLEQASTVIMQSQGFGTVNQYQVDVWTDSDMDSNPEKSSMYVDSNKQMIWAWTEYLPNRTTVQSTRTWTMTNKCVNRADSVPLFRFYSKDGTEITDLSKAASDAYVVRVNIGIVSETGAKQYDYRDITIRTKS